jgi:hypothetical protein
MDHLQYPRHRRSEASVYLKVTWGIDRKPATLAKYASRGSGPKIEYAGHVPLYPQPDLDAWAKSLLSPRRVLKSDNEHPAFASAEVRT